MGVIRTGKRGPTPTEYRETRSGVRCVFRTGGKVIEIEDENDEKRLAFDTDMHDFFVGYDAANEARRLARLEAEKGEPDENE